MKQKLLIKIIDDNEWKWVHLCYIDTVIYKKLKKITDNTGLYISSYISQWILEDFKVKIPMTYKKDLFQMRTLLETWYHKEYPEIFIKNCPGDKRRISGIISIWITQHINYEYELLRGSEK